jgi:hypothetical protein
LHLDHFAIVGADVDAQHRALGLAGIEYCVGIDCLDGVQFGAFSPIRMDIPWSSEDDLISVFLAASA